MGLRGIIGVGVTVLMWSLPALAQEAEVEPPKPVPRSLTTKYSIDNGSSTATSTLKGDNIGKDQHEQFLFERLSKALLKMPFISSVQQTKAEETKTSDSYTDTYSKNSHIFVGINAGSPVTMLFKVEETYQKCKTVESCSTWYRKADLKVKGPYSVYGNFASVINVDALLREKQELSIRLESSADSRQVDLTTTLKINAVNFDESLARLFKVFNIPSFAERQDQGIGGVAIDSVTPLTSRQRLMLGMARIMRQTNEKLLTQFESVVKK